MSSQPAPEYIHALAPPTPALRTIETAQSQLEIVHWHADPMPSVIVDLERWRDWAYQITKRVLDVVISASALLIGLPLFIAIGIAVKLHSPGPILFRHQRLGRFGTPFCCYKFRTMVADAESQLHECSELRKAFLENFKLQKDPRVTRLGVVLRNLSLDELPQFWNVLKGDMTLIGPRPIVPEEIEKYGALATRLLSVSPGLSGLWQTCGRSNTSYDSRIQLDMLYISRKSFVLDLVLLARTVSTVLRRAGAC